MQREDFLSIWISLKTYQLRGIPTTLETKINHKINIHTNIFQKNHKKEFGPRLTEKRNSIGPQRVNLNAVFVLICATAYSKTDDNR